MRDSRSTHGALTEGSLREGNRKGMGMEGKGIGRLARPYGACGTSHPYGASCIESPVGSLPLTTNSSQQLNHSTRARGIEAVTQREAIRDLLDRIDAARGAES